MKVNHVAAYGVFAAFFIVGLGTGHAQNGNKPKNGWGFSAEISGVWVGGNSSSRTVGLDTEATHGWNRSHFTVQGGGLRTESTVKTLVAVGSQDDFILTELAVDATTAETFFARTSYEYRFSEKSFILGGVDWLRNTFQGIDSRFLFGVGAGSAWIDSDRTKFDTTYGFTYTFESEVVENPFNSGRFPGLRLTYLYSTKFTPTTTFRSRFAGDWNLDNTKDIRVDWTNSISVSIVSALALKPSLKLQWRNDPSLQEIPLASTEGNPLSETVRVPLKEIDTFLTLALLVTV